MKEEEACSGTIKQNCSGDILKVFIHRRLKNNQFIENILLLYDNESIFSEFAVSMHSVSARNRAVKR